MKSPFGVVVTAYKPDLGFFTRFAPAIRESARFIVVDNTPGGHTFENVPKESVLIVQDGKNKGLGKALNIGIESARQNGLKVLFLFDQDSSPSSAFLQQMLRALETASKKGVHDVCVGPRHIDDTLSGLVAAAPGEPPSRLKPVNCLPTSGMLFRVDRLKPEELFTEDFFLDFVDFDWCWRLAKRHWQFYRAMDITMPHRLGLAERHLLGLTYHVPAPYRHYFQFRDTLRLLVLPYVPLYSKIRLGGMLPLKALVYPFLLDRGLERARWMARGVADAFRRIGGIGAARETLDPTRQRTT